MRIAVVDDFQKDRDSLALYLEGYLRERNLEGDVFGYPGGEEFLEAFEEKGSFDIVFMDIYMNGIDGMETARQLRLKDKSCRLIFVTSSDSFAIEGYKVQAFRYLVKPFEDEELRLLLDALFYGEEGAKKRPYLEIRQERVSRKVYIDEIVMAELEGHYTVLYLSGGGTVRARMTVRELEKQLTEKCFLECYRNILVNLDYVEQVEEGRAGWEAFVLQGGKRALIQRTKRSQVRQYFTDYLFWKAERGEGRHGS